MIEEIIKKDAQIKIFPMRGENGNIADIEIENQKAVLGRIRNFVSDTELEVWLEGEASLEKNVCYVLYILSYECVYLTYVYYRSSYLEGGENRAALEIVSPVERVQRRKHQRVSCHSKIVFRKIPREGVAGEENALPAWEDTMVDISGGGIRFTTKRQMKQEDFLQVSFDIEKNNQTFPMSVRGQIVYAGKLRNEQDFYDIRMKYVGISEKDREQIIHYVFQLERNN